MAMGKPLVVSDTNILPEIVKEGENGHVFSIEKDSMLPGLVDFSDVLMLQTNSKKNRTRFGNRARMLCEEKYSFPVLVREMESVYKEVLNSQQLEV